MADSGKTPLLSMLPDRLRKELYHLGLPKYRADQVLKWLYDKTAGSFDEMTNLSVKDRKILAENYTVGLPQIHDRRSSREDGSVKLLLRMHDGEFAETVLIKRGKRRTVCVSSQVGCKFRCVFCASGQAGFGRHLSVEEIVSQVLVAKQANRNERISNIVFMGMGEPMDNLTNVLKAIEIINDGEALGIGARKITISTSGIVSKFDVLEKHRMQIELSVSLHGPNDLIRGKLMPVNRKWPVKDLIKACHDYSSRTKRQITFEYLLADGLNASRKEAFQLAKLLKGMNCKVNLIPLNPIPEFPYKRPIYREITAFQSVLKQSGIPATVRFSRGNDITAACGQLRRMQKVEA